jgi:hypothetical protein
MEVCINNVTFGTGDDWKTAYGDVREIITDANGRRLGEVVFHGTTVDCEKFIDNNGHEYGMVNRSVLIGKIPRGGTKSKRRPK